MRRSYKTTEEITPALEQIILDLRSGGKNLLPPERELMQLVGASRMTLRKSLDILASRGVLAKESKKRMIGVPVNRDKTVALVGSGWDYLCNPIWFRVHHHLEKLLKQAGFQYREVLFGWKSPDESWPGSLADLPDYLIFTDAPNNEIMDKILDLRGQCTLISADEDYQDQCDYVVSLNNFQAGHLAAQTLLQHGSRNPACIYWDMDYRPFKQRRDGFAAALTEAGLDPAGHIYPLAGDGADIAPEDARNLIRIAETVSANGHDGLFLYSDENARLVFDTIGARHSIPKDFHFITLEGSGDSRNNRMLMSAVSHNVEGIAQGLLTLLENLDRQEDTQPINLIDTEVLNGNTL